MTLSDIAFILGTSYSIFLLRRITTPPNNRKIYYHIGGLAILVFGGIHIVLFMWTKKKLWFKFAIAIVSHESGIVKKEITCKFFITL